MAKDTVVTFGDTADFWLRRSSVAWDIWKQWHWPPESRQRKAGHICTTLALLGVLAFIFPRLLPDEISVVIAYGLAVAGTLALSLLVAYTFAGAKMEARLIADWKEKRVVWWETEATLQQCVTERDGHIRELQAAKDASDASLAAFHADAARKRPDIQVRGHRDDAGRCYAIVTNRGAKATCQGRVARGGGPQPLEGVTWQEITWGMAGEKGTEVEIKKNGEEYVFFVRNDVNPVVTGREFLLPIDNVPMGLNPSSTGWSDSDRGVGLTFHVQVFSDPPCEDLIRADFTLVAGELKQFNLPEEAGS